jgi:hypothetical protein
MLASSRLARVLLLGVAGAACGVAVASCSSKSEPPAEQPPPLTKAELMDPATCGSCHITHYREWSGSMHAYAAEDPLFLAMNARGQAETKGALGNFCVNCHAPLAVKEGATTDGLNLDKVDAKLKGITCYYCHSIDAVEGTHNAPLRLATDGIMRAALKDPASNAPHKAGYSALHDGTDIQAAGLCGSCHDLENPLGTHLQATFTEWKGSLFAHDEPSKKLTCNGCHMPGRDGVAAVGGPPRRVHDHSMPSVDVALTPFPQTEQQKKMVQANLDASIVSKLCIKPQPGGYQLEYSLDDAFAGHDFPSGSAYHRRAWVEITVKNGADVVFHSGDVPAGTAVSPLLATDKQLWVLGDHMKKADGTPTEMLWDAASMDVLHLLPAVTNVPSDPAYFHAMIRTYDLPAVPFDSVRAELHLRPVDYDFVDDLIASKYLDAALRDQLVTFTLAGTIREWTKDMGPICLPK